MAAYDIYDTIGLNKTLFNLPDPGTAAAGASPGGVGYDPPAESGAESTLIPTPTPSVYTVESYDYELEADRRWDQLSMDFFGTYNRIMDLMDANPQISLAAKCKLYVPAGTRFVVPSEESLSLQTIIGAKNWRA